MINVIVSNNLKITNPTDAMWKWAHENLVIDNPDYEKKVRMNKWIGNTPKYIFLCQKIGDILVIPFGCVREFHKRFADQVEYKLKFGTKHDATYTSKINLFDYQEQAVKSALKLKNGIIVMPCGRGKTQTAI